MLSLEEIREKLQDRVSTVVADRTGLTRQTVSAIKNGEKTEVRRFTRNILSVYLEGERDDR